jgi:hypothetical protein
LEVGVQAVIHRTLVGLLCCVAPAFQASAEEVKFADLEGMIIDANFTRDQVHRREGQTISVKMVGTWKVAIEPEQQVTFTYKVIGHTRRGSREAKPVSATFVLDQKYEMQTRGRGEAMWTFADGALTFTRTQEQGAYRFSFLFADSPNGMACSVKETFARENGRGEIKLRSPFDGSPVTIISAKVVSSSCKVGRKS